MSGGDLEVFIVILTIVLYVVASLCIHLYKIKHGSAPHIHESTIVIILGFLSSLLMYNYTGQRMSFENSKLLFYIVLVPIIFNAGYTLRRKKFFNYIIPIACFGIIGTGIQFYLVALICYYISNNYSKFILYGSKSIESGSDDVNIALTWVQSMILSSVISASDEVSALSLIKISDYPQLGAIVFGEGILNDVLSISLFHALVRTNDSEISLDDKFSNTTVNTGGPELKLMLGMTLVISIIKSMIYSTLIGLGFGLTCARIFKVFPILKDHFPVHQLSMILLFGLLSYSLAEALSLSGILTLLICSITLGHYAFYGMSMSAKLSSRIAIIALSDISEGFSFAYLGLSFPSLLYNSESSFNSSFHVTFILLLLIGIIIIRFIVIYLLSAVMEGLDAIGVMMVDTSHDDVGQTQKMTHREKTSLCFGGLVRGSIAFAQALMLNHSGSVKGSSYSMDVIVTTCVTLVLISAISGGILLPLLIIPPVQSSRTSQEQDTSLDSTSISISTGAGAGTSVEAASLMGVSSSWIPHQQTSFSIVPTTDIDEESKMGDHMYRNNDRPSMWLYMHDLGLSSDSDNCNGNGNGNGNGSGSGSGNDHENEGGSFCLDSIDGGIAAEMHEILALTETADPTAHRTAHRTASIDLSPHSQSYGSCDTYDTTDMHPLSSPTPVVTPVSPHQCEYSRLGDAWEHFDNTVMKQLFGGSTSRQSPHRPRQSLQLPLPPNSLESETGTGRSSVSVSHLWAGQRLGYISLLRSDSNGNGIGNDNGGRDRGDSSTSASFPHIFNQTPSGSNRNMNPAYLEVGVMSALRMQKQQKQHQSQSQVQQEVQHQEYYGSRGRGGGGIGGGIESSYSSDEFIIYDDDD